MPKHHHIQSEDSLDKQVASKSVDTDTDTDDSTKVDAKVGIVRSITGTIKASKILQIGIFALLVALAIAIAQGRVASMFGIVFTTPPQKVVVIPQATQSTQTQESGHHLSIDYSTTKSDEKSVKTSQEDKRDGHPHETRRQE